MITHGNIIIIHIDDKEPSMAIIPRIDFQKCKTHDIFHKIKKLQNQFENCNFKKYSLLYENENSHYSLNTRQNMTLSKWFQTHNISKDENNNYIFYVNHMKSIKSRKNTNPNSKNKSRRIL